MNAINEIEADQEEEQKETKETKAEANGGSVNVEEALTQSREGVTRRQHPAGEVFFRGEAEQITDAEAEEVARRQLERSGLLRGQRVRVAD